jgi:hypothetical protein
MTNVVLWFDDKINHQKGADMGSSDRLQITVHSSSIHDDPFARNDGQYARDIKQFLTTIETQGARLHVLDSQWTALRSRRLWSLRKFWD